MAVAISWTMCKSAPRSRQITMPVPHQSSFLQAAHPSCRPTNSVNALKAKEIRYSKTVKSRTVSTGQKKTGSKITCNCPKNRQMKKHTALKQNIKNDTCIEFRRDIKALTLLADTTCSVVSRYDTIRDAILTCAQKLTA